MENEKNEMTLFTGVKNNMYCSIVTDTEESKKQLFNALETCDALLNDCVGQEIEIKDIYVEERQVIDEESGFDVSGQTYAAGSYGIYNIIRKIVSIYGLPTTWENPIKVKVSKRPIGNGKQSLTLTLV